MAIQAIPVWVYYALLAASTAANYKANVKRSEATGRVMAEERAKRKETDKANEAAAKASADTMTKLKEREAERAAELAEVYKQNADAPTTSDAGTRFLETGMPTGSTRTVDATNQAVGRAMDRVNARGERMGRLGAFGDVFLEGNLATARNAQDIGLNSSIFRGWQQNALPALLARANEAGRDWGTAADVMKLAASVLSMGALSGANAATSGIGAAAKGAGTAATSAAGGVASTTPIWQGATGLVQQPGQMDWFRKLMMGFPLTDAEQLRTRTASNAPR